MRKAILMAVMLAAALVMTGAGTARATDAQKEAETKPVDPAVKELRSVENPHIKVVESRARALVAPLSQPQMQDLYLLRDGYGIVKSVEIVVRDVGNAVKLCGLDNPDMKKDMSARYDEWAKAVNPVLKDNMKKLQDIIDKQTFTEPKKIRDYFKALDDATSYADKKFDKRVVTTPEACASLRESMDDTQVKLVELLGQMRYPDLEKAKAEEAAAKEAAEKAATEQEKPAEDSPKKAD